MDDTLLKMVRCWGPGHACCAVHGSPLLSRRSAHQNPLTSSKYSYLTDNMPCTQIENYQAFHPKAVLEDDEERGLLAAQDIILRIRNRQIYKFVNEIKVPSAMDARQSKSVMQVTECVGSQGWAGRGQVVLE